MYKMYKKKTLTEATPWTPEFDMTLVSVSEADKLSGSPKVGDMIARNPNNPDDLWLIEANTFAETYEPVVEDTTTPVVVDAQVEAVNITPAVIVENDVSNGEGTDAEGFLDNLANKVKSLFKKKEEVAKDAPSIDCESELTETTVEGLSGDAMAAYRSLSDVIIDDCDNNKDVTLLVTKLEEHLKKLNELYEKGIKKIASRKLKQSEIETSLFDPEWGVSKELYLLKDMFTRNQGTIDYINDSIWIDDNGKEKIDAASITKLKALNKSLYDNLKKVINTIAKGVKVVGKVDKEEYTIGGQLTVYEVDEDVASYVVDRAKVSEMLEDIKMVSLPVDARVEIMNGMTEVHRLIADSLVNADTNSIEITKEVFRERVILHTIPVINGVLIKNELPKVSLLIDSEKSEKLFILDEEENVLNLVLCIDYANKTFWLSSPDWDFISMLRGKVELISTEVVEAVLPVTSDAKEAIATADVVTDSESYKAGGVTVYELGEDNDGVSKSFSGDLKTVKSMVDGLGVIEISAQILEKIKRDLSRGGLKSAYKKEIEKIISKEDESDAAKIKSDMDNYFDRPALTKNALFETLAFWYTGVDDIKKIIIGLTITELNKTLKGSGLSPITAVIEDAMSSDAYFILISKDGIYKLIFDRTHDNDSFSVYVPTWNIIDHLNEFVLNPK